jgi:hypothetical protein
MLAEVMDPVWKTIWHDMQMDARRIRMVGWLLVAGEGYYVRRAPISAAAPSVSSSAGRAHASIAPAWTRSADGRRGAV